MTFWEFVYSLLGGGTLVALVSALLLFVNNKKGHEIDWYDRAIVQVKELDAKIKELEAIIAKLNDSLKSERDEKLKLQELVREMEFIIKGLKIQIEGKIEDKKKGSVEHE